VPIRARAALTSPALRGSNLGPPPPHPHPSRSQMVVFDSLRRAAPRISLLVIVLVVAGCVLFSPPKAKVAVADIAAAFPEVDRLGAVVYMYEAGSDGEPDCEYFEYRRGAFTSKPEDRLCRVFDFDGRHTGGGDEGPIPVAFDEEAHADLVAFKRALDRVGAALVYMNAVLAADGSVGPDSGFKFDRCVAYWYQPGWTSLPEDIPGDISSGINEDWYNTDGCR
jgi:hypothetical protein